MTVSIYIETTIPSFYHTLHSDEESHLRMKWTRQWWDEYANEFRLVTSAALIDELDQSSSEMRQLRIDLMVTVELLPVIEDICDIAQTYIDHRVMPNDPTGDALHLALASFYEIDCLLTWNCKHIANANKIGHIRKINAELGLPTPELTTPLNYLGGED